MTREKAIGILKAMWISEKCGYSDKMIREALNMAIKALEQEPKIGQGHWIEKDGYDGDTYYDCSVCGESWTTIEGTPWNNGMRYCPNCGAKMAENEEDKELIVNKDVYDTLTEEQKKPVDIGLSYFNNRK